MSATTINKFMRYHFTHMLQALFVLNLLDIVTTKVALSLGGFEANPFMAPFVEGWGGMGVKFAIMTATVLYLHLEMRHQWPTVSWIAATPLLLLYIFAAINNTIVIARLVS